MRFYSLNENMMNDKADKEKLGYFVADMEMAGPYSMLAEARAVANGDPSDIGYLSGNNFQRGFPEYARAFNTAFLSLPALPSVVVAGASSDKEVVVRQIVTPGKRHLLRGREYRFDRQKSGENQVAQRRRRAGCSHAQGRGQRRDGDG